MKLLKWVTTGTALILLLGALLIAWAWYGWVSNPIAQSENTAAFYKAATDYIEESGKANVAFVLVEKGKVFTSYYSPSINSSSLFPLASMSKWLTAYGVMTLVAEGRIDLDLPVSTYLTRWQLPPSEFDNNLVTTRRLLSHTAGLHDDLGFADWSAAEILPSLEQSLAQPRASSGEAASISVAAQPGSGWKYSGGSYLILELLIEEVSGVPFAQYMQTRVFDPLRMTRSTYDYLGALDNTAASLTEQGEVAPFYQYEAKGATGLSSTPDDLTLFVQAQINSIDAAPLTPATIQQMRSLQGSAMGLPIYGLGNILYASTDAGNFIVGHAGQNEPAINTEARINPETGDAIIVLVTGNASLATRLGFLWTFWQTGRPDIFGIVSATMRLLPWFGGGVLISIFICVVGYRRTKKHSIGSR